MYYNAITRNKKKSETKNEYDIAYLKFDLHET